MSVTTEITITGEQARRLADLHSVLHDLNWVQAACVLAIRQMAEPAASAVVTEALQATALIRYCRSFECGAHAAFSLTAEMVETLPVNLRQAHLEFCVLRDKYIVHSDDESVWNVPTAHCQVNPATGNNHISWLTVEHYSIVSLPKDSLVKLYSLALTFLKIVRAEVEKEEALVLGALNTLPVSRTNNKIDEPGFRDALCAESPG